MANQSIFLKKLQEIVLENYTNEQFGVSDLAEQYGISRSQLHRRLKSATGQSLSQFIREIRLGEALKLLRTEDTTASEVAYMVGFNSPTYFNTCFNEYFGYPPGEAQLQMELAKSKDPDGITPIAGSVNKKNKRVVIWLFIVIGLLMAFFLYEYSTHEKLSQVNNSEEKEKSIAVLPLKNWSGDVELEYVSDGMTDAIISRLAEIEDMDRVIPFTSIIVYKDSEKDLSEIASELNVEYILEGNFKLSGKEVRSDIKLIEVETLEQLWNIEYSGTWKSDEIFEMQAEVARRVANSMSVKLGSNDMIVLQYIPTSNEEAYRVYLKADFQFNKLSKFGLENAIALYEEAIRLDSTFVEPYLGLGSVYLTAGAVWGLMPQQEAWKKSKQILESALELDSLGSGLHREEIISQLHVGHFYYDLDIQESEKRFAEISTKFNNFEYRPFIFDYARKTGRLDLAIKGVEYDITNNPTNGLEYMQKAILLFMQGDTEQALQLLEVYDPLFRDNYFYLLETSKWYFYMGELEKSKDHLKQLLEDHEDRPPIIYWLIAVHSEIEGDELRLKSGLDMLQQQFDSVQSGSPAWFLALYYFHINNADQGFDWLNRSYDRNEVEMTWLKEEPMLQGFKEDPRYIELYEKMGFQYVIKEFKD